MKFDSAGKLEEVIWTARLADLPRSENRAILQRLYNGEPPFDPNEAEENNVEINRNNLTGVTLLSQARRQWNNAFLGQKRFFNVSLDSGPKHKRQTWSEIISASANKVLKKCSRMREQIRATGANVMLHGIGPVNWPDKRTPVPCPLPVSSLLIASETEIGFDNLEWFAVFRELTPTQLYMLTHGPKVDPGWNMPLVKNRLKYVAEEVQKRPNATAYQYMPERIEELIKQDMGYFGTDAVPTIDIWDFYFREAESGDGWYRRILLDWGIGTSEMGSYATSGAMPKSQNVIDDKSAFLYTSGKRKYASEHSQIIHCQFGDTSAYAPFKYHSVRSLGWMLWGPADLDNRLYCKFMENVFMNLMWWFRVSGENAFNRIKRADFFHMGVIPQGVTPMLANERFQPDSRFIELGFAHNQKLMQDHSSSFTSDWSKGTPTKAMTATETMARVDAVNSMVSGMLTLAYSYEEPKLTEICRRLCIKNNPDKLAKHFRKLCITQGVPEDQLDVERWAVECEKSVGGGNKTMQMAMVNFLNSIRKNMNPQGQRIIDHLSVFIATEQAGLADEIAPIEGESKMTNSMHDATLAMPRLMQGLPYPFQNKMVAEDYVRVWLLDLGIQLGNAKKTGGNMADPEEVIGWGNVSQHIKEYLGVMSSDPEVKMRVRQYQDQLKNFDNEIRGYVQRIQEQMKQGGEQNGAGAEEQAKLQAQLESQKIMAQAKAENLKTSHAMRTAQKQAQFEMDEQRKDRQQKAEIRREDEQFQIELDQKQAEIQLEQQAKEEEIRLNQKAKEAEIAAKEKAAAAKPKSQE